MRAAVETLCKRAPMVAQFFVREIPKHLRVSKGDEDPEQSKFQQQSQIVIRPRKQRKLSDPL